MQSLPKIDYLATWRSLAPDTRNTIGQILIEETLLRFASGEYQADTPGASVTYLDADGRDFASGRADCLAEMITKMIEADLPELFGEDPSDEHPFGTDPAWAKPTHLPIPQDLAQAA